MWQWFSYRNSSKQPNWTELTGGKCHQCSRTRLYRLRQGRKSPAEFRGPLNTFLLPSVDSHISFVQNTFASGFKNSGSAQDRMHEASICLALSAHRCTCVLNLSFPLQFIIPPLPLSSIIHLEIYMTRGVVPMIRVRR